MLLLASLAILKYMGVLCINWYEVFYVFAFIKLVELVFGQNKNKQ